MVSTLYMGAAACLLISVSAFPFIDLSVREATSSTDNHEYQAPGKHDSRSPCPGLNTLANHGYLPRNGRNVSRDDIISGFSDGFNFAESAIIGALDNAFSVCYYVEGQVCENLTNLTLLAEPHTLEHDHSMSRQDYHMAYSNGAIDDNQNFNSTIFQTALDAVGDNKWMNYTLANKMRLTRESLAWQADLPGWFIPNPVIMGVEIGFIFGVASDPTLPDYDTNPQVRVDWWNYWVTNESFPTPLGWKKSETARDSDFVGSVHAAVYSESLTATPSPQPPASLIETNVLLLTTSFTPVLPLPTDPPYVAPGHVVKRKDGGAAVAPLPTQTNAPFSQQSEDEALEAPLEMPNWYNEYVPPEKWASIASARQRYVRSAQAAIAARAPMATAMN